MKIAVLGAGAFGTALANLLLQPNTQIAFGGHNAGYLEEIRRTRLNDRYLPGIMLPPELLLESDLDRAIAGANWIVVAVPSKAFREVTSRLGGCKVPIVSVTKGIEFESGLTMCGILAQTAPNAPHAALSGPTFAIEVARGVPTAIVAASRDLATAAAVQHLVNRPAFRGYTATDLLRLEVAGALENVIAIAAGIGDGLGFGDNAKAALVTRAVVEIRRLGVACGAQAETFTGLSGLGDLMVTCFSRHSRNRAFGERIGHGEKAPAIASAMPAIAE